MHARIVSLLLALTVLLTGCSTFDRRELGYLQSRGVSVQLLDKLDHRRPLTPSDAIELAQKRIPDSYILRHLRNVGLDYVVTRSDAVRMRRAGVNAVVIDAFLRESDDFARDYTERQMVTYYSSGYYGHHDPWMTYPRSSWGVGLGYGYY